jgi:hypothetical protein
MKRRIFTFILLMAAAAVTPHSSKAWGTDVNVNPVTGEVYTNARVAVAYDGTIYVGRLVKKPTSISFQNWEILKSTDNGATFTVFADNFFSGSTKYTNFDLVAAGNNATDFRIFTARTYIDTATDINNLAFNKIDQSGTVSNVPVSETSFTNSRGYTGLALATDSRDKNSNASPYSISLVVGKASLSDSVVVWTDNVGGTALVRRGIYGTAGFIRKVSASIGSASSSTSGYGRLGIVWEEFAGSTSPWGDNYVQYIFPDDATDPGTYSGVHQVSSSNGVYRNPSIALSQNTSAYDIRTIITYEYDNGSNVDVSSRVDTVIVNSAPAFASSPGVGTGAGDQLNPNVVYNAATDSFMVVYHNVQNNSLVYKRVFETSVITSVPATASATFRDASSAMTDAFPRIDGAATGGKAVIVWNDGTSTYIDAEAVIPASVQSASLNVADLKLYPNPATDLVNISFTATENDKASIAIMDMSGRILQTSVVHVSQGANVLPVKLQGLPAGNYMIRMNGTHVNTSILFAVTP